MRRPFRRPPARHFKPLLGLRRRAQLRRILIWLRSHTTDRESGTLECGGGPIPQNAEYVFRNVPLVKMQLDYDTKTWDARLAPGDGQTQKLIVRNKSSGPQKHCVVHWTVVP